MNKPIVTKKFVFTLLITLLCIYLLFVGTFFVSMIRYIQASQLKTVEDISPSEAILIQKDFGIDLPPEAEIISFGYSEDEIFFRIEGVVDLEAFLTESLSLEIDAEEAKRLSDLIHQGIERRIPEDANMDETAYFLWGFHYHEYNGNLYNLHSAGLARSYYVYGEIEIDIEFSY